MRAKILTLRFSPTLGRFDDAALVSLQQKVVLEHVREHLVQIGDEAMLVCVATWREQPQAVGTALPRAEAAPCVRAEAAAAPIEDTSTAVESVRGARHTTASGPSANGRTSSGPARPVGELRAELDEHQRALFDRLRAWRSRTAQDEGAPPYVILTNRQLVELVLQRPESKAGIARIHGLGDKKVARHGDAILQQLWGQQHDPSNGAVERRDDDPSDRDESALEPEVETATE